MLKLLRKTIKNDDPYTENSKNIEVFLLKITTSVKTHS